MKTLNGILPAIVGISRQGLLRDYETINEVIEILLRCPVYPAVKQLLVWMGFDCGSMSMLKNALK